MLQPVGLALRQQRRWLLVALLANFHLVLLAGVENPLGLILWMVNVGLFFLWQPFVDTQARLNLRELAFVGFILAGGAWLFGWWLLIVWAAVLSSLVGGRVMFVDHRPSRVFYLLAFAYLLTAIVVWLMPRVVPDASAIGPMLDRGFAWGVPLLLVLMVAMPDQRRNERRPAPEASPHSGVVDFFYSLFIFLLIAVLVLGSLAFMVLRQSLYIEAVFKTLLSIAVLLFLIAWAWNPRPGFSGVGVFFSRYLLTLGLPFEQWLHRLASLSASEADPERFLAGALEDLRQLPWVAGGSWGAGVRQGRFGDDAPHTQAFPGQPLSLTLFTRHALSPALAWHFQLLVGLVNQYYLAKQRERELRQVSYLRAVYETGSRLTHDVKNLLQSLNNLCYLAQTTGSEDAERLRELFQRQLPQITLRLEQTMGKLQKPRGESGDEEAASDWWASLVQRYANDSVSFEAGVFDPSAVVPSALFDSVVDNLLQNALVKRQGEAGLKISVNLSSDARSLRVHDEGSMVPAEIVFELLQAPVASENGLGIGLYQAARQARDAGYELRLVSNGDGNVCFELRATAAVTRL